ncbi:MAG: hypothetical protein SFV51_24600, partial [Bryobacteraceae bacterium]|nr:hypothetical protein [Bryobacteraceae bacterium]
MARARGKGLNAAQAAELLEGYERSNLTRREYCARVGIPLTTFDYYRRLQAGNKPARRSRPARFAPVKVIEANRSGGFVLVLSNGRRIESDWGFA